MAVAKNRVVVAELLKQFKDMNDDFLAPLKSMDEKVNNDVIDFNEIGADPDVLINNVTYPIDSAQRTDEKRPVSLNKYDTKNTDITDDEIFALPYDKKSSVIQSHKNALKLAQLKLGAWSLSPEEDDSETPVIQTTGATVNDRKRMVPADLIALKQLCDALEIPIETRHLILSSKHVGDLLLVDQTFRDRYNSTETGKMMKNLYGFNIFESIHTPKYDGTDYTKKAFGAAAAATDVDASVFYSNLNTMKATGSLSMYLREAAQNPEYRKSTIGFRMYNIVANITTRGIAAIVDEYTGV